MTADRLANLIDGHYNGALNAPERQELDAFLVRSEDARTQFVLAARLHVQLFLALNRDTVVPVGDDSPAEIPSRRAKPLTEPKGLASPRRSRSSWLPKLAEEFMWQPLSLVLLAAAIILGGVLAWQFSQTPSQPVAGNIATPPTDETRLTIARLAHTSQTSWAGTAQLRDGTKLAGGEQLELKAGLAEIVFDTGVSLILEGPAEFVVGEERAEGRGKREGSQVKDRNCGFLAAGKLVAMVPSQAKGFTIHTPGARVVDLGTEFGVQVRKMAAIGNAAQGTFSTEVQVFQGRVTLESQDLTSATPSKAPALAPLELTAGEGAVYSPGVETRTTNVTDSSFVRKLPDAAGTIAPLAWTWPGTLKPGDIVVANGNDLKLVKIDPKSGVQTLLTTGQLKVHGNWDSVAIDRRGNVLIGAHGLPKIGIGILRINPRDGAVTLLASGETWTANGAQSISGLAEAANGDIYAVVRGSTTDRVMKIDPVSGASVKVAALDDASGIHMDVNGHDLFVVGSRTAAVALVRDGAVIERVVDRQQVGTPLGIAAALDGRIFLASTQGNTRKILEVSRDAQHTITTVATLPSAGRPGGRWNIALEADGNLLASPWRNDIRVLRIHAVSGNVSVVAAEGMLSGEAMLTVVPQIRSQPKP